MNTKNDKKSLSSRQLLSALGSFFAIFSIIAVFSSFVFSGDSSEKTESNYVKPVLQEKYVEYDADYTVTFMNGDNYYAGCGVNRGQSVLKPTNPIQEGRYFEGWYLSEEGGEKISFPLSVNSDLVIYARFSENCVIGFSGLTDGKDGLVWTDMIAGETIWKTSRKGEYVSVSSELDNYFPFSEIEEFTDSSGNVFIKFPKCYIKFVGGPSSVDGFKVANYQAEEDMFIPDCFLDPSDTTCSTYLDYFALGKYEASHQFFVVDSVKESALFSNSGKTVYSGATINEHRELARFYGSESDYYGGYQLEDYAMHTFYNMLCMLYYRTGDIQSVYAGRTGAIKGTTWVSTSVTGTTDGVSGLNGWNTDSHCVKMLGVENPFGNIEKYIDGVRINQISYSGTPMHMLSVLRLPQYYTTVSEWSSSHSVNIDLLSNESGIIKTLRYFNTDDSESYITVSYPASFSIGTDSEINDFYNFTVYTDIKYACVISGGNYKSRENAGLWYWSTVSDSAELDIGSRLAYRPVN